MKDHYPPMFIGVFLILLICYVPKQSLSQTPVDRLVDELDGLGNVSFDSWKYTTRFSRDSNDTDRYSRSDFDDSDWDKAVEVIYGGSPKKVDYAKVVKMMQKLKSF